MGEVMEEVRTSARNADNSTEENTVTNGRPKTIVMWNPFDVPIMKDLTGFQDSCDALLPSTSTDPQHIVGFQVNPELQEQQKEQQKAERKAANAPIDLRDVLNQKQQKNKLKQLAQKQRARELTNSNVAKTSQNPSPVQQPEARRVRLSEVFLSQTETRQYDITAKDTVRLQLEIQSGSPIGKSEFRFGYSKV